MNWVCKVFGHRPDGWYLDWQSWSAIDGIGREHRGLDATCRRCGERFHVGKVHMPAADREKNK